MKSNAKKSTARQKFAVNRGPLLPGEKELIERMRKKIESQPRKSSPSR